MNETIPDEFQPGDILTHKNNDDYVELFLHPYVNKTVTKLLKNKDFVEVTSDKKLYIYLGQNHIEKNYFGLETMKVLTQHHGVRWIFRDMLKKL